MDNKIKILHLEDSLNDSHLIKSMIESGGIVHEYFLTDNEKDYLKILKKEKIDLILSDFSLPGFHGNEALKVAREKYSHIPFIFISGTIGEEAAINSMLNGASDYVLKNKLERLVPAIKRALNERALEVMHKEGEKALTASETRYRQLFESAKEGILILDAETGTIIDINPYLTEKLGHSHDQFIGKVIWKIEFFKDIFNNQNKFIELLHKQYVHYDDLPLKTSDGKQINVEFISNMYLAEYKKVIQCRLRDITDRKQASYTRSLIEASKDPLVAISPEGKITDMNEAFTNITGMRREQIKGTDFFDYFMETQKAREVYEEIFAKGFVADYPLTLMDFKKTEVLFNGSVYKDEVGNIIGAVAVARDITERKKNETKLMEALEIAEHATGVAEEAKRKAESATLLAENAVKAKQQFLSNMSHEIRTPMNAIIGFTKVVLKTDLSDKQKEYLTAIKLSGDALIVLINDILDLAKVDAGKMTFEQVPFKMSLSIAAMLHLFEIKIQEKNLELVKIYDDKIPEILIGDPVRLHQIILNLISNAVKFTNRGKIVVGVHMLNENDEKVTIEFSVEDTGIGIAKDKINNIFENFQQATSDTSRLYGGTGLGLSIVKQLVESQGGIISVKSKVNVGSTFSFILNFLKTNAETESDLELVELNTDIKNIKVLVVEDIALNQLLMKTLLDDFGFEREIADNGKIAIEKLQTSNYDIILMDLQMPEMNGFEATDYIRNKMNSKIPIIALTADVTTVDLAKCKAVGMNDYIAKPVDERLLYNKIVGLVKKPAMIKLYDEKRDAPHESKKKKKKCIDLAHLYYSTKSKPALIMEMISLYLEQTPRLVSAMKQSLKDKDWNSLYIAVHKMIPSFSIVGISSDYAEMAKKVQEYASTQTQLDSIPDMVHEISEICEQACDELIVEFNSIKKNNK
jgi:PAS domain S-box-containing protein